MEMGFFIAHSVYYCSKVEVNIYWYRRDLLTRLLFLQSGQIPAAATLSISPARMRMQSVE